MEVSRLSVIPDSDEGAWSGSHGICLVLGLKLAIVSLTMSLVRSRGDLTSSICHLLAINLSLERNTLKLNLVYTIWSVCYVN